VKTGGGDDCIGAIVAAFNEGRSVKLRLARITHASNCLICLRLSLWSCAKNNTPFMNLYHSKSLIRLAQIYMSRVLDGL